MLTVIRSHLVWKVNYLGERYNLCRAGVFFTVLYLLATLLAGCEYGEQPLKEGEMALTVLSSAFQEGERIPSKYSCQGEDVSPPPLVCQVSL